MYAHAREGIPKMRGTNAPHTGAQNYTFFLEAKKILRFLSGATPSVGAAILSEKRPRISERGERMGHQPCQGGAPSPP